MILIAADGEAWQVGANELCVKPKGSTIAVPLHRHTHKFARLGFEIPEKLPDAPPAVVEEVLNNLAIQGRS